MQDLNVKVESIKLSEKSIAVNRCNLGLCSGIFYMTFKAWIKKEKNSIGFLLFDVQLLSQVCLYVTPRSAAHQASLSFTISQNLPKCMPSESAMLSNRILSNIKNIVASEDTVTKGKTQATDSTPIRWAESPAAGQQLTGGYWAEHVHGLSCSMNPTTWWPGSQRGTSHEHPRSPAGRWKLQFGSRTASLPQHPPGQKQAAEQVQGQREADSTTTWRPEGVATCGARWKPHTWSKHWDFTCLFFSPSLWNVLSNWSKQIF